MTLHLNRNLSIHSASSLISRHLLTAAVAAAMLLSISAPLSIAQTPTMIVLHAVPQNIKKGDGYKVQPPLTKDDIGDIKLHGKPVPIVSVDPLLKGPHTLQLMILFDSMQSIGGNGQFDSIRKFIDYLPPNVEVGVGWMLQSHVKITQPLTADHKLVDSDTVMHRQSYAEAANPKNSNGNIYACVRDLSSHWPGGNDPNKIRAVLMFSDGLISSNAQPQGGDQDNPDVTGLSNIMQTYGVLPYPFYYQDNPEPTGHPSGGYLEGQEHYTQLAANTGGYALYEGQFSPGSFDSLLDRLYAELQSAVVVTVNSPDKPTKQVSFDATSKRAGYKIFGPDNVTIGNTLKK